MISVTSKDNPTVKHLCALRDKKKLRREEGLFLCEGEKVFAEARSEGMDIDELCVTEACLFRMEEEIGAAEKDGARVLIVPEELLRAVSGVDTPQGVVFSVRIRKPCKNEKIKDLIICDNLRDPGNLGTVIRTADAFGAGGVFLCGDCVDAYAPKTVRACMGSIFRVPIYEGTPEECKRFCDEATLHLLVAKPRGNAVALSTGLIPHSAVAIGNEAHGVSPELEKLAENALYVDMSGRAESLNAAVCAAVILWHMQSLRK